MSIKNLKPTSSGQFKQGYFNPKNPEKYIGDLAKIIFRSSWELKFMQYCDNFNSILRWSSEPIKIPYILITDSTQHNYNVDFYIRYKNIDDIEKDYIIEIKPERDKNKPKKPLSNNEYTEALELYNSKKIKEKPIKESKKTIMNYNRDLKIYLTNMSKFNAAKEFAEQRGMEFLVLTETFLYNEKIKL